MIDPITKLNAGFGDFTTTAAANGGGFMAGLGDSFKGALDTTLTYGLPELLDFDTPQTVGLTDQIRPNAPQDMSQYDPELIRRIRQRNNGAGGMGGMGGNVGLYVALGVAAIGVVLVVTR